MVRTSNFQRATCACVLLAGAASGASAFCNPFKCTLYKSCVSCELHGVTLLRCCSQFTYTVADARRSPVTNDDQIRYSTATVTVVAGAAQ
jgi:hypothetical protein